MTAAHVLALHRFTDDQALAWLASRSPVQISCVALAKQFQWHRNTVGTKLRSWSQTGKIERRGKVIKVRHNVQPKTAQGGTIDAKILGYILILIGCTMAGAA